MSNKLRNGDNSPDCFIVVLPFIGMRMVEEVPTARELTLQIASMLRYHGYDTIDRENESMDSEGVNGRGGGERGASKGGAHFVSHSFGTVILAYVLRFEPFLVARATFLDPVCRVGVNMFCS